MAFLGAISDLFTRGSLRDYRHFDKSKLHFRTGMINGGDTMVNFFNSGVSECYLSSKGYKDEVVRLIFNVINPSVRTGKV